MIAVVANPHAGRCRRAQQLVARLKAVLGGEGQAFEVGTRERLQAVLAEVRELGACTLGICGGDGTVRAVTSALVRQAPAGPLPHLLLLPGGTVNTVAGNLGVPGDPVAVLRRFMRRRRARRWIPRVQRSLLRAGDRHGFLLGIGMPPRFFEAYYGGPRPGVAWASVLAARVIASSLAHGPFARRIFDPVEAEVVVDGRSLPLRHFTLMVAGVVAHAGLGFRPTYRGGLVPGRFHLVATGLSPARLAANALRCLAGRSLRGEPTHDRLARKAQLRFAQPQPYIFDGDLFRAGTLELGLGPRVTFLRP